MALSMSFSAPGSSNQGQHSDTWNGAGPAIETVDYTTWREQLPTPEGTPSYGNSPENGPVAAEQRTEGGLSFPVAPGALQSQLEAWSTLSLDPGVGRWHPTTGADGWSAHGAGVPGLDWGSPHSSFHGEPFPEPGPSCVSEDAGSILVGSYHTQQFMPPPPPPHQQQSATQRGQGRGAPSANPGEEWEGEEDTPSSKEDKRKRNTTASARFRVKKKEREKQFEEERVQLREKVADLEKEVSTLKHENAWLRELILEKARPVGDKGDETPMPKAND